MIVFVLLISNGICSNKARLMEMNKLNKMFNISENIIYRRHFSIVFEKEKKKMERERKKFEWIFQIEKHLPYVRLINCIEKRERIGFCLLKIDFYLEF